MGGFSLVLILAAVLRFETALCIRLNTGTAGTSTTASHGHNQTSSGSPTTSAIILGTGMSWLASQKPSSNSLVGTGFTSGPCPTDLAHYPSFVRPSATAVGSCDIYGPLCQTGSIAVGVNVAKGVTTTTVPCSCYLTAQSLAITPTAEPWKTGFWRSPQCNTFLKLGATPSSALAAPIFSNCPMGQYDGAPSNFSNALQQKHNVPNGPVWGELVGTDTCCGICITTIPRVRIAYFPGKGGSNAACAKKNSATKPSITPAPSASLVHRALHMANNGSIAVSNGFTYTWPSIYVEIEQPFSMADNCGPLGSQKSSTIMAFPPGAVSTLSYEVPLGANLGNYLASHVGAVPIHTKTLDPDDLACPTWGLSGPFDPDASAMPFLAPGDAALDIPNAANGKITEIEGGADVTIGPPFFPIIRLPTEILTLDSAWARCTSNLKQDIPIFDPPRTLVAQAAMAVPAGPPPTPTPALEMVPPSVTSSPSPVAQQPAGQPAATPAVETGLVLEHSDPTDPNKGIPGIPAGVDSASSSAPGQFQKPPVASVNDAIASTTALASPPANPAPVDDPKAAAVSHPGSAETTPPSPPANAPLDQSPGFMQEVHDALSVSTAQAAAPAPGKSPAPVNSLAPGNSPAPGNLPAATVANSPAQNSPIGNSGPANSPPADGSPGGSIPATSAAPAPAFAGVMGAVSGANPGPEQVSSSSNQGIGAQIMKPFAPVTTAQSTVEIAPIAAGPGAQQPPSSASPHPGSANSGNNDSPPSESSKNANSPQEHSNPSNGNSPSSPPNAYSPPNVPSNGPPPQSSDNAKSPYTSTGPSPLPSPSNTQTPPDSNNANSPQEPSDRPPPPVLNFEGSTYQRGPSSNFVIASQTLIPGSQITIASTPVSLASDGGQVVVGSTTQLLQSSFASQPSSIQPASLSSSPAAEILPVITVGSSTYTRGSALAYIIASQTLGPGAEVTVSNTPISLASDGGHAIIGSSTQEIIPGAAPTSSSSVSTFDIGGKPFFVATGTSGHIDDVTLAVGGPTVTISSTPVAMESSGILKIGSSEIPIATAGRGSDNGSVVIEPSLPAGKGCKAAASYSLLMVALGAVVLYLL